MNRNGGNKAIFFASFATLLAAGMGFSIRGAIAGDWQAQFGFTKTEVGGIFGWGLAGFGITIIGFSLFVDVIGYKALLVLAFLMHTASAIICIAASPVHSSMIAASGGPSGAEVTLVAEEGETAATSASDSQALKAKNVAWWMLAIGMGLFSLANGVCEAVINPLVATLFPDEKTHYLNILHAGWPGGLILGAVIAFLFAGAEAYLKEMRWELLLGLYLVPTLLYGLITLARPFPISEVKAAGISFGEMLLQFFAPVLLFLFLLHAMVGYVELGTDSWIVDILNSSLPKYSVLIFIYTSSLMFILRFFAGPIVERINPVGLLFVSAVLGAAGLYWLGTAQTALLTVAAATVYGVGKTFYWPTMLGVVGERYPRGGALTMGTIGGIGMLSAGLLGAPGIGYKQDYFASKQLAATSEETYEEYKASDTRGFLFFPPVAGLDGTKVAALRDQESAIQKLKDKGEPVPKDLELSEPEKDVLAANLYGGKKALQWTAAVPATMAIGYLLLVLYFKATGGYKVEKLHAQTDKEKVGA